MRANKWEGRVSEGGTLVLLSAVLGLLALAAPGTSLARMDPQVNRTGRWAVGTAVAGFLVALGVDAPARDQQA